MAGLAKPKILVVCGPTATGKSALAIGLCQRLDGELVNADSMQVYAGLQVGTAAVTQQELEGVPLHLGGFLPPQRRFSVAEYVQATRTAISDITGRGKLPVLCGGTGLYIQSLLNGVVFAPEEEGSAARRELEKQWEELGAAALHERLAVVDPECAGRLHQNDAKRIIRALEAYAQTGFTARQREEASRPAERPYTALCLGLDYTSREELYTQINKRVDSMLQKGLLREARLVYENRADYTTAAQAIGYKEFFPYFENEAGVEACTEALKQATRRYAKRQLTWFKRMEEVQWLQAQAPNTLDKAFDMACAFLQEG